MTTAIITRPNCYSFIHCKYECSTPLKYGIQFNVVHKLFAEIRFPYACMVSVNLSLKIECKAQHFGECFTENRIFICIFSEAIHWKYNFMSYILVNHSLKIALIGQRNGGRIRRYAVSDPAYKGRCVDTPMHPTSVIFVLFRLQGCGYTLDPRHI